MSRHTGHRLGAAGIRDTDELVKEGIVFVVVPVAEDDGKLCVIRVLFCGRVDHDGSAETVDVLSLLEM